MNGFRRMWKEMVVVYYTVLRYQTYEEGLWWATNKPQNSRHLAEKSNPKPQEHKMKLTTQACFSLSRDCVWSKESNRLGASCLKTEAEPASETLCVSVLIYLLHDGQSQKKKTASVWYLTSSGNEYSAARINKTQSCNEQTDTIKCILWRITSTKRRVRGSLNNHFSSKRINYSWLKKC